VNLQTQRSGYVILSDDDDADAEEDADARVEVEDETCDDEHVSEEALGLGRGGIGLPETNAAVAARDGVQARVRQQEHVRRRTRSWFKKEADGREIIWGSARVGRPVVVKISGTRAAFRSPSLRTPLARARHSSACCQERQTSKQLLWWQQQFGMVDRISNFTWSPRHFFTVYSVYLRLFTLHQ
jgi:hypothetical protein